MENFYIFQVQIPAKTRPYKYPMRETEHAFVNWFLGKPTVSVVSAIFHTQLSFNLAKGQLLPTVPPAPLSTMQIFCGNTVMSHPMLGPPCCFCVFPLKAGHPNPDFVELLFTHGHPLVHSAGKLYFASCLPETVFALWNILGKLSVCI